jgi:cytochrome c556
MAERALRFPRTRSEAFLPIYVALVRDRGLCHSRELSGVLGIIRARPAVYRRAYGGFQLEKRGEEMARVWSWSSTITVAGLAGFLAFGPLLIGSAAGDAISDRRENRKQVGDLAKQIKAVVDANGPAAGVVEPARKIVVLEANFEKLFPPGSDKGDTKALPVVWSDAKGFEAASHNLTAQATKLADAGAAGKSPDEIKAAFGEMGKACGGCHNTYRAK